MTIRLFVISTLISGASFAQTNLSGNLGTPEHAALYLVLSTPMR